MSMEFLIACLPPEHSGADTVVPSDVAVAYANIEPLRRELQAIGLSAKDVNLPKNPKGPASEDFAAAAAVDDAVTLLLERKQQAGFAGESMTSTRQL